MSKLNFIIGLSVFLALISTSFGDASPDMVVEVFRHGARGPTSPTYDHTWDPSLIGELTPAGMRMQYLLGAALRQEYPEILGQPFSRDRIYARSSQKTRCINSLQSQLFGAFEGTGPGLGANYPTNVAVPPSNSAIVNELLEDMNNSEAIPGGYVPIVIDSVPESEDVVLETPATCPASYVMGIDYLLGKKSLTLWHETLVPTRQILKDLGFKISNPFDLERLGETLICNYFQNKPLPGNITYGSELYKNITFAGTWFTVIAEYTSKEQKELLAVPLFAEVFEYLDAKAANQSSVEFVFLSTHDTALLTILSALDIVNEECLMENYESDLQGEPIPNPSCLYPPFAANIIFEFYQNSGNPYIIFKYNGVPIELCESGVECSYSDFKALVQKATNGYTVFDYKVRCLDWIVNGIEDVFEDIKSLF